MSELKTLIARIVIFIVVAPLWILTAPLALLADELGKQMDKIINDNNT